MADLVDTVREQAAHTVATARAVRIDDAALGLLEPVAAEPPPLDPTAHYLDGSEADVADWLLQMDAINFGSGWFPTIRKRADPATGRTVSGYFTIATAMAERARAHGVWTNAQLRAMRADELAAVLGQRADHELMALYAQALRELGTWLGERRALDVVAETGASAVAFATALAGGMALWDDRGFYKRAQIAAADLGTAGVAPFRDVGRLTIFADNLVPHVLRCDGVLRYAPALAARIDGEQLLAPGPWEREIRAAAVHACGQLSRRMGVQERVLDYVLWQRGQQPAYKARPRHRCPTVFY